MRYSMRTTHYGQDLYDSDDQSYLNTDECVAVMNELDEDCRREKAENKRLKEAFNLCYDHLCDLHFAMKTCPKSYQKQILEEIDKTAKTNQLFIDKKKEEEE